MAQTATVSSQTRADRCPHCGQIVNNEPDATAPGVAFCPYHSVAPDEPQVCTELLVARRVQQALFPKVLPDSEDWEFAATCRPARAVAGDYYDVFQVGSGLVAIALGDVAGKGLGPSLVMGGVRAMIRGQLPYKIADLAGFVGKLNQYLESSIPEDMFVTLFLAVLDKANGALRFVNAGHPPPILLGEPMRDPTRMAGGGLVLGVEPQVDYEEQEVRLAPGSILALYSDGVTETSNGNGQSFDEPHVLQTLHRANPASARSILTEMLDSVDRFRKTAEQQDDMTLVIVRRQTSRAV